MTREEAYKTIKENLCAMCAYGSQCMESCDISTCDNREAIKVLEQEPVLDKIRAEIKQLVSRYTISRERGCSGQVEWEDRLIREVDILQIIDKYKAETE